MDEVGRFRCTVRRQQHNTRTNNKPYRQFPLAAANSRVLLGDQDHGRQRVIGKGQPLRLYEEGLFWLVS